eukprot:750937-Hanusia_phi.AAC.2
MKIGEMGWAQDKGGKELREGGGGSMQRTRPRSGALYQHNSEASVTIWCKNNERGRGRGEKQNHIWHVSKTTQLYQKDSIERRWWSVEGGAADVKMRRLGLTADGNEGEEKRTEDRGD